MTKVAETQHRPTHAQGIFETRYGTGLIPSTGTAIARPQFTTRPGRTDTAIDILVAPTHEKLSWFYHLPSRRPSLSWPSAQLLESMRICLRIEEAESGGSTEAADEAPSTPIDAVLDCILARAEHEDFEPGMCSQLEEQLRTFVGTYGEDAVRALHGRILRGLKTDIVLEILGALGRMRLGRTRDARLATLATFLQHRDVSVRDAAASALLAMEDGRARRVLREAWTAEPNDLLKQGLQEVLDLLPA